MKSYMFPGQGSQEKGMGKNLFNEFPKVIEEANQILGYSIKEICLNDPNGELNQTQFAQPAIFIVNALHYYKKREETGEKPNFLIGHSLGELNALLAAECFNFEVGVKIVKKRGELMSNVVGGGMAAILNASKVEIERTLKENKFNNIELSNFNTSTQIVISGPKDEIIKSESFFQKGNIRFIILKTSGAFHSKYMQPAKEEFESFLNEISFNDFKIPVISNVTAREYKNNDIKNTLAKQITSPVKWSDSIKYLMGLGNMKFEEIGYKSTLYRMVKSIEMDIMKSGKKTLLVNLGNEKWESNDKKQISINLQKKELNHNTEMLSADEKVAFWNKKYPIGTKVKSILIEDQELETRTEAVVLFGHRAAVYIKNFNGYFDLDELEIINEKL